MYMRNQLLAGMVLTMTLAASQPAVAQDAPAQEAPKQNAPAQNAPAQNAPAQTAPAQNVPAQNAPAQSAPAPTAPAQRAVPPAGAAAAEPARQTLQVLDGKLRVAIPAGFTETEFPPDPAAPDITGKIYLNTDTKQAIIVVIVPMESTFGDDDAFVLGSMAAGFQAQQQESVSTFKKTGQSTFKVGSMGVLQLDATSKLSDRPAVLTALFAASGAKVVTFSAYTLIQEQARHAGLVKELTQGMTAAP
ncbi:hypothetical protein ASE30_16425 [Achromobacter sp. Root83]|uniref:hypothetical protein n=1 Tax=Achromobacter sp. Root83 TaxID=1736602 RepID=UPI0007094C6F|nr:hypothetical protein [Achromobacter sp. Root83]KRC70091.1 hypothetical protein ASE30_16425 [Achromobacter sp. Root83]